MTPKRKHKEEVGATVGASKRKAHAPTTSSVRPIELAVMAPFARSVSVVGEFNNWRTDSHPLQPKGGETWHITLELPPGTYQYKFVIDGRQWEEDANNPKRTMNEFGTFNSVLEVL